MKSFLLSGLILIAFSAQSAGFSAGDKFNAITIEGRLSVQCPSETTGPSYGAADCRFNILTPAEYTYFVGTQIDADSVSLQATHENGSVSKIKTEKYDGAQGKSRKPFNLWISTLLQRPLLDVGINSIKYTLTKNGQKVEEGIFTVEVVKGAISVCPRVGHYFSSTTQDCSFPTNLCSRFFNENNYCQ